MAAVVLQVVGLSLGIVSWCLVSSCLSSQQWKLRSQLESVSSSQRMYEGLWNSCASSSTGSVQCNTFKTTLGLPVHLQACRAFMALSLLIGLVSIIVSVLGLKCTKIGQTTEHVKQQIALSGGVLFILAGLLSLTAVSWYAARVIQDFFNPLYGGVRYELGPGLYLGWAASGLSLLGGSLLCCSCKKNNTPPPSHFTYNFTKTSTGPQIYRADPHSENSLSKAYV